MKTDYKQTGKLYKKIDAYRLVFDPNQPDRRNGYRYFGSSVQFRTCKGFREFLSQKYPDEKFITHKACD